MGHRYWYVVLWTAVVVEIYNCPPPFASGFHHTMNLSWVLWLLLTDSDVPPWWMSLWSRPPWPRPSPTAHGRTADWTICSLGQDVPACYCSPRSQTASWSAKNLRRGRKTDPDIQWYYSPLKLSCCAGSLFCATMAERESFYSRLRWLNLCQTLSD